VTHVHDGGEATWTTSRLSGGSPFAVRVAKSEEAKPHRIKIIG
jgi:hypothetical protein